MIEEKHSFAALAHCLINRESSNRRKK